MRTVGLIIKQQPKKDDKKGKEKEQQPKKDDENGKVQK